MIMSSPRSIFSLRQRERSCEGVMPEVSSI